jgi:hypothetical protein
VSHPEFLFEVELSSDRALDSMLADIARAVCRHLGLSPAVCDALVADFKDERDRASGAGHRRSDVRFESHTGELAIVVRYEDGGEWRRARALS